MMVAVTGADGFIGTPICRALRQSGIKVRALGRGLPPHDSSPDLSDPEADWESALEGCEVVINLAGRAHDVRSLTEAQAAGYMEANARGAARVAEGAAEAGAGRFIQVSTIKVLGESPADGVRFREADGLAPVGVYAQSKAEGEVLVQGTLAGYATESVILRLPLVFGTPFKGNLALLEKAVRRGLPLPLSHRSIGARTYVQMADLERLLIRLVLHQGPLPPVVHARSSPDLTAADVARLIGREVGRKPRLFPVPARTLRTLAQVVGRPEYAAKICDEMLVSDGASVAFLDPDGGAL